MGKKKRGKFEAYSTTFRARVLKDVKTGMSINAAGKKHGVANPTIKRWVGQIKTSSSVVPVSVIPALNNKDVINILSKELEELEAKCDLIKKTIQLFCK